MRQQKEIKRQFEKEGVTESSFVVMFMDIIILRLLGKKTY